MIIVLLTWIFGIVQPACGLTVVGYEMYDGTNDDVWVVCPVNMFHNASEPGDSVFPVEVEVQAHSYVATWLFYWIPSQILVDAYIRDWDSNAPESVFDLGDCHVWAWLVPTNAFWNSTIEAGEADTGTITSDSGTIGFAISRNHWKTASNYYHLGQVKVDINGNWPLNVADIRVGLDVLVSSLNATIYEGNHYTLFVRVTVVHALWWWINRYGEGNNFVHEFRYIGDGSPGTDAMLYLLPEP